MKRTQIMISIRPLLFSVLLILAIGIIIWIFAISKTESKIIDFPYGVSFTKPSRWVVEKRDSNNHVVLTNSEKEANTCTLDIFAVRPDRDYEFKQWLGTSLENESFLATGREMPYKDKAIFIGSYNFFNENINGPAKNERAIIKAKGTLVDIKMSYRQNESCTKIFDKFLDSVNF